MPNVYSQVIFYFSGNGEYIALPINPGELKITRTGLNKTKEVITKGEINILREPGLHSFKISSYFPRLESVVYGTNNVYSILKTIALLDKERLDPEAYIDFFQTVEKSKKPLKLVITDLSFSMMLAIDKFEYTRKGGEHKDVYFDLTLKEWINYGATKVTVEKDANGKITNITKTEMTNTDKELGIVSVPSDYTATLGETLWEIARRLTGDGTNYSAILRENNSTLPSGLEDLAGKVLRIPTGVK